MKATGELTARITTAVAAERDLAPNDLPPLYDAVEPDALEVLVDHADGARASTFTVRFRYAGTTVTVGGSGEVTVDATGRGEATAAGTSDDRVQSGVSAGHTGGDRGDCPDEV